MHFWKHFFLPFETFPQNDPTNQIYGENGINHIINYLFHISSKERNFFYFDLLLRLLSWNCPPEIFLCSSALQQHKKTQRVATWDTDNQLPTPRGVWLNTDKWLPTPRGAWLDTDNWLPTPEVFDLIQTIEYLLPEVF